MSDIQKETGVAAPPAEGAIETGAKESGAPSAPVAGIEEGAGPEEGEPSATTHPNAALGVEALLEEARREANAALAEPFTFHPGSEPTEVEPYVGLALTVGGRIYTANGDETDTRRKSVGVLPQFKLICDGKAKGAHYADMRAARAMMKPHEMRLSFEHTGADGVARPYGVLYAVDGTPFRWWGFLALRGGAGTHKTTLMAALSRAYPVHTFVSTFGEHSAPSFGRDIDDVIGDFNLVSHVTEPARQPDKMLLFDGLSGLNNLPGGLTEGGGALAMFGAARSLSAFCEGTRTNMVASWNVEYRDAAKGEKRIRSSLDNLIELGDKDAPVCALPADAIWLAGYPADTIFVTGLARKRNWRDEQFVVLALPPESKQWELLSRGRDLDETPPPTAFRAPAAGVGITVASGNGPLPPSGSAHVVRTPAGTLVNASSPTTELRI